MALYNLLQSIVSPACLRFFHDIDFAGGRCIVAAGSVGPGRWLPAHDGTGKEADDG